MKFGKVEDPSIIDFSLPPDHPDTKKVLQGVKKGQELKVYVGCAKWNRQDLKNFYPRGTKDELEYYSTQFNSIELNATFYRIFDGDQFEKWKSKVPNGFKFFPKLNQEVSHWKRLNEVKEPVRQCIDAAVRLEDHLGTLFLQMNNNFTPKDIDRVEKFVEEWPKNIPLAIEFRHTKWFSDDDIAERIYYLLEAHNIANVLVDSAGRRDIMHMRLTNNEAFVRYVGANHPSDYPRLDDWVDRLEKWVEQGLTNIHFFIHQNVEKESPLLATYFIKKINEQFNLNLHVPQSPNKTGGDLFS
ncbi:DUF72 domain-containing protein [Spongiivirga sp. MCCC 1A20706]|uniref:DUF72 domain-containing protein n=1 Tax=Spongiivirga sp. MCCC 1A20706 TaxID=3160963 RepID=UPI0039778B28